MTALPQHRAAAPAPSSCCCRCAVPRARGAVFLPRSARAIPRVLPSVLIGHPAPQTNLPPVAGLLARRPAVPGLTPPTSTVP